MQATRSGFKKAAGRAEAAAALTGPECQVPAKPAAQVHATPTNSIRGPEIGLWFGSRRHSHSYEPGLVGDTSCCWDLSCS